MLKKQTVLWLALLFIGFSIPLHTVVAVDCSDPPQTGDTTIATSCTFAAGIEGPVGGHLVIAQDITLTIRADQKLVWPVGKEIQKSASGAKIVIIDGGQIAQGGSICLTDADGDYYPASLNHTGQTYSSTTCSAGNIARGDGNIVWLADCNDSSNTVTVNQTCYPDADSDGQYASSGTVSVCAAACNAPSYSVTAGTDCCDSDANAFLGQTLWFPAANLCSNHDYDCDTIETKRYTGQGSCNTCGIALNQCASNGDAVAGWTAVTDASCGTSADYYNANTGVCLNGAYPTCNVSSCTAVSKAQECH